jgi:DNA-directed RNA polymerase subunit M/transcription elongation factor TFIIS
LIYKYKNINKYKGGMSSFERKAVTKVLERNLKKKTAENYEKQIYRMCRRIVKDNEKASEYISIEVLYPKIAYEKVGQLILCEDRQEREKILVDIKDNITGFDTQPYEVFRQNQKEECSFTAQGPKVEEGEFPCRNPKCKSKRCYWYQLQTRSGDEGMTIFVTCIKCKTRYKKND